MERSSSTAIKLVIFIGITFIFVWAIIAYASARKHGNQGENSGGTIAGDHKRIEKTFSLKPGGSFELTTDLGEVTVEGWANDQVLFKADITGGKRFVEDFEVSFDTSVSQRIAVRGRNEHHGWFFDRWDGSGVHFTVKVPNQCSVDIKTSGGDVGMTSLQGDVRGSTSGGSVTASEVRGTVVLNTSGGSVRAKDIEGSCEAKTSGGGIHLDNVKGPTLASTSGGSLDLKDIEGRVDARTSGGGIYARLHGAYDGVSLRTSGGSITVEIPDSIAADIDASTSGGSVQCDLPVNVRGKMDDDELVGKMNGGGNSLHLRTSGGNIHIRQLH